MVGNVVGRYRVLEPLGSGGMGVVYRAFDTRLSRHIAIKFLSPALTSDAQAVARFEAEARAASALNHPHICTIHDIGEDAGQRFIVMELLEGQTLSQAIGGRPLPPVRVIELSLQIADALRASHAHGILHRDIKPSNIFVTRGGDAKLLDSDSQSC